MFLGEHASLMEIEVPAREHPVLPQCRCVVIAGSGRDRCPQRTPDPDSPFCEDCAREHQGKNLGPNIIVAVQGVE